MTVSDGTVLGMTDAIGIIESDKNMTGYTFSIPDNGDDIGNGDGVIESIIVSDQDTTTTTAHVISER